jgi:serine/threonine-protein kinase
MSRFRIEVLIADGRRGPVYLAHDEQTQKKVIFRSFAVDCRFVRCPVPDHIGIAARYEAGKLKGVPYVAVEYLDAPSLAHTAGDAATVLSGLLAAVAVAHDHTLLHGHLRAHNVHILPDRGPVIADYGLPQGDADLRSYKELIPYLAPEQIPHVRQVQAATDIYGIGLIGYALLSGRLPFDPAALQQQLIRSIVNLEPERPPGPGALVDLVMEMLAKKPDQRPTARDALERIVPKLS